MAILKLLSLQNSVCEFVIKKIVLETHTAPLCLHVNIYGTKITQHGKVCSTSREKKRENMARYIHYSLTFFFFLFTKT